MASVTMGRLVDEDGELVNIFLYGTEKGNSKDSLKSLPMNATLSGMDDSGDEYGNDFGKDSSSSFEFKSEGVLSLY
jgi:hypothetical protein